MDRNERAAFDELTGVVSELTQNVVAFKRGAVDRETVENIVADLLTRQVAATGAGVGRRSVHPADSASGFAHYGDVEGVLQMRGRERLDAIHTMRPSVVAPIVRRPRESIEAFQQAGDRLLLLSMITGRKPEELDFYGRDYLPTLQAALDTSTAAEGSEFVPTMLSGSVIERIQLQLTVVGLFVQVEMPSNPYDLPGITINRLRTGIHAEATADTGNAAIKKLTPGTRKVRLEAKKLAAMALISREAEEDAVLAMLPLLEQEIIEYISADLEDAVINGDATGAHMDSDVTVADDVRKLWDGLRARTLAGAKTDGANAALTVAMLRANRKTMGRYGARPDELAHIVSIANYVQLLADTSVLTLEKYGPQATILTGELGKVDGAPVVVSELVRSDLNATGVFDNVTTNRSLALTVNRRGWMLGNRRGMTVEVLKELYSEYDQDAVKVTTRKAFEPRYPTATERIVSLTYNLSTA